MQGKESGKNRTLKMLERAFTARDFLSKAAVSPHPSVIPKPPGEKPQLPVSRELKWCYTLHKRLKTTLLFLTYAWIL